MQPRQNRYARKNSQGGQSSIYTPAPEYDDPANCAEEDQYVSVVTQNSLNNLCLTTTMLFFLLASIHSR